MSLPELLTAEAIESRRGGPFPADEVAAACAAVRGDCGWHVAPRVEEYAVLVSGPPGPRLVLPSLAIVTVHSISDVVTGASVTGWRTGAAGMLVRDVGWPRGEDNLEVVLTHGYEECPADLVAVVLERCRALSTPAPAGARSFTRTTGGVTTSTTYSEGSGTAWSHAADAVLARYRV